MILTDKVTVKWSGANKLWYQSKGYGEYKHFQKFEIPVIDLMPTSPVKIKVMCDYCKVTIMEKHYHQYIVSRKEVKKDCCRDHTCQNKKRQDVFEFRYGVRNASDIDGVKAKREKTNIAKYGHISPLQNEDIKKLMRESSILKNGVPYHTQTKEWKDTIKEVVFDRYGVDSVAHLESTKEKRKATNLKRYGNTHALSNPEIKAKSLKTKYDNNSQMSSRQQRLIHKLIGGALNYPYYGASLDIAIIEEKIYIEYDGGGHELSVKLGSETKSEFEARNRNRWYSLYRDGWKEIRITSKNDKLPSDEVIVWMIEHGKEILKERTWVNFDLDNSKIITSKYEKEYDYGILRNTYKGVEL